MGHAEGQAEGLSCVLAACPRPHCFGTFAHIVPSVLSSCIPIRCFVQAYAQPYAPQSYAPQPVQALGYAQPQTAVAYAKPL